MRKSVLITDVDNTLYDWVYIWHTSFSAMLPKIYEQVEPLGVSLADLKKSMRVVFQKRRTSEYTNVIQETQLLRDLFPGEDLAVRFSDAIDAYGNARRDATRDYPEVKPTLAALRARGVQIIAYTESRAFYTADRFRRLGYDGLIDILYSPPDHEFEDGDLPQRKRTKPDDHYKFVHTVHLDIIPEDEVKPNPKLLRDIMAMSDVNPIDAVYVGDNLMKDIAMSQDAGVTDVWAQYGGAQSRPEYRLLQEVSHWPDKTVEREKIITTKEISPTYTLDAGFDQVLGLFDWRGRP